MSSEAMSRGTLIAALAEVPHRLGEAARPETTWAAPPGEWGPNEVVRHLIAVETDVHQARLADLAADPGPHWDWVEPGPWSGEPGLGLEDLLTRFEALRAATLTIVTVLDETGWARTGTHARLGVWDVAALLRNALEHDEQHLAGLAIGRRDEPRSE
jgi:hypothetical protein